MSTIRTWAAEYGVPLDAVVELERRIGLSAIRHMSSELLPPITQPIASEARQQSLVRLEAADKGVRLYRNNVGAYRDDSGQMVRYGLANDSAALNKVLKSSDLVGWRKRHITANMVGSVIAQVVLREMKSEDWTFSGSAHERAQSAFLELCIADGGDARFATGPGTL